MVDDLIPCKGSNGRYVNRPSMRDLLRDKTRVAALERKHTGDSHFDGMMKENSSHMLDLTNEDVYTAILTIAKSVSPKAGRTSRISALKTKLDAEIMPCDGRMDDKSSRMLYLANEGAQTTFLIIADGEPQSPICFV